MTVEMQVYGVGKSPGAEAPLVVLKEAERERYLAISVGPLEIGAITAAVAGAAPPRPMTHDLLCSAIEGCGGRVTRAVVHSVIEGVFHAHLILDVQGRHVELDSRSSDAIAVAVRVGIPIHVEEAVLERAGITPLEGGGLEGPGMGEASGRPEQLPEEERIGEDQLGAFRDVIKGLDLDDLGKGR